MLEYNPETHIAVPKEELARLEECRVNLYNFLEFKLNQFDLNNLVYITKPIYNVANRIKWEK